MELGLKPQFLFPPLRYSKVHLVTITDGLTNYFSDIISVQIFFIFLPIAHNWYIWVSFSEQTSFYNNNCRSWGSHIFLSSCIYHWKFIPIYFSSSHIRTKITYDADIFWEFFPWKLFFSDFESMNSFVHANMKKRCIFINFPCSWIW